MNYSWFRHTDLCHEIDRRTVTLSCYFLLHWSAMVAFIWQTLQEKLQVRSCQRTNSWLDCKCKFAGFARCPEFRRQYL